MNRFASAVALAPLLLFPALTSFAQPATAVESTLPKAINPDSRNRLSLIKREDLDERRKKAYDAAVASYAGAAPAIGAEIRLHGRPINNIQLESPLGHALMQLAILTTARAHDQPYEWSLHEMQAIAVGLDPRVIDQVRNRKPLNRVADKEAVIIRMGREIFGSHRLSTETYSQALSLLGESNLVDVAALMADYARTSATLTAFNQQLPPGWKQFLPLSFMQPDDIHPDSRSRLPLMTIPAPSLAPALYGRTMAPEGTGPAQIRQHGAGLKSLEASVGRPVIDLAILVTAREHDMQYDWTINELASVRDGLQPTTIEVVRNRLSVAGLAEKDACAIQFGRELFSQHNVSSQTYQSAVKLFGERDLVDLVDVMGQHAREATLLAAFDQQLPAGQKPRLPVP
jgi:4-carboxymuconolactone decarboxylase